MRKSSLSPLGYLMDYMNMQTGYLAQTIHVDASLVSKWKSGSRALSPSSIYFDDVINAFLKYKNDDENSLLKSALFELFPSESPKTSKELTVVLRRILASDKLLQSKKENVLAPENAKAITVQKIEGRDGRREAVDSLLSYAESLNNPGELLIVDNEDFEWLLEDASFALSFEERIEELIHRGFYATFLITYSSSNNSLSKFFGLLSPLIFHRNISWYSYEYYDHNVINYSFFILNRAVSILGFSSPTTTSSLIFSDQSLVISHELIARHLIEYGRPLFSNYKISEFKQALDSIYPQKSKGALYSYLPSPVFLFSSKELLTDILKENMATDTDIEKVIFLSETCRNYMMSYFSSEQNENQDKSYYIFHLGQLLRRADGENFISQSLTLAMKRKIYISPSHYASMLEEQMDLLKSHDNFHIVLVDECDDNFLPAINCWCKQNQWMLQMNNNGLRLCDEYNIVRASTIKWERCIRQVPDERKRKESVLLILSEMVQKLKSYSLEETTPEGK